MRRLTRSEIDTFASRPNVRALPVCNFLGTLPVNLTELDHRANAASDAAAYKWNLATLSAILDGIHQAATS